ncbi:DUF58 domain-containing protein [Lacunimicrobium album]
MRDFIDPRVVSRLSSLALDARMPMVGNVTGRHRSPTRGSSLEFAEYRKYVPGDDTRRLDWRAWGRSDRYYIKEFEADTNLRMCLVVDISGSMKYGVNASTEAGKSRLDYARRMAGTLAYVASGQGDSVGLYCAGENFEKEISPKRSAAHLKLVLDELGKMEAKGMSGLPVALHDAAEKIQQRALVVIFSDLLMDPDVLKGCFQHLRFRKHDVVVFHLLDPTEVEFKFDRPLRFLDLEGGAPMLIDPVSIARQYREAVQKYLEQVKTVMRESGVDYHRVNLEENYADVLVRFLLARKS